MSQTYENLVIETTMGTIYLELYWAHTPRTCKNIVELARKGYYDGTIFHRVIKVMKIINLIHVVRNAFMFEFVD